MLGYVLFVSLPLWICIALFSVFMGAPQHLRLPGSTFEGCAQQRDHSEKLFSEGVNGVTLKCYWAVVQLSKVVLGILADKCFTPRSDRRKVSTFCARSFYLNVRLVTEIVLRGILSRTCEHFTGETFPL